jgi:cytochrome P460
MRLQTLHPGAAAILTTAAIGMAAIAIRAQSQPDVPYPHDFRSWHHVKSIIVGPGHPSFAARGGIHHYYANDKAIEGYRTGTFANGSVIVDEGVFTREGEGAAKGIVLEADRRSLDLMVKDDQLYKDTAGWGFDHFNRDDRKGTLDASGRAKCEECHSQAARDHVYSSVRP